MSGGTGAPMLRAGRDYWRKERADRAALLIDAEAYFAAFRAACLKAERIIRVVGWDIHSRTRLLPADPGDGFPIELGPFFTALLREKRRLRIDILIWEFAMIFSIEREPMPLLNREWAGRRRLRLRFAADHPLGAAHHQKIVVVDDALAFAGGIDLTMRRWDTPQHQPRDGRRMDPAGELYPPFHDLHFVANGPIARALAQLARERWWRGVGEEPLPLLPSAAGERWPDCLAPDFRDVEIAIARTEPLYDGRPERREAEHLWLSGIAAATRMIYVESQYFTSAVIADAIAARLVEPGCPDIVIILPRQCHGWLEQTALADCQARLIRRLGSIDTQSRLRFYYPVAPALDGVSEDERWIRVHAKVLIVDDRLLRVGSSNLSNRSMGVDTECDLAVEGHDARTRCIIAGHRASLLGEHLGRSSEEMAAAIARFGLVGAIETLGGTRGYELRRFPVDLPGDPVRLAAIEAECARQENPFDPERPIRPEKFLDDFLPEVAERPSLWVSMTGTVAAVLAFAGLVAAWHLTPLAQLFTLDALVQEAGQVAGSPFLPFLVVSAFVVGGFLLVPVVLLIAAAGVAFGPLLGCLYAAAGAFASAAAGFFVGRWIGREPVCSIAGTRLNRIGRRLAAHGFVTVTALRLLPVAPYALVNLVAGAMQLRFRDFLAGTVLGMMPGIVLVTMAGASARELMQRPTAGGFVIFIAMLLLLAGLGYLLQRWLGVAAPRFGRRR